MWLNQTHQIMKKVPFIMLLFSFLFALSAHGQSVYNMQVYTDVCFPGHEWDGWESDAVPCFRFTFSGTVLMAEITVQGDGYSASVPYTPGSCLTWPDELATGTYVWRYQIKYFIFPTIRTISGGGPPFYVDIDAPNTPVVSVTEGTGSSSVNPPWTDVNNPTFTWSDPGDDGSGVSYYEVSQNGQSWQEVSSGWQPGLSDGIYTFDFRSVDGAGNTSASQRIHMQIDATAPTAVAGSDAQKTEWETYTFDGSSSSDNIGIADFTWSFQDSGSDQYLYGASPSYTFNNPGVFEVLLTVSDSSGTTDTDTVNITVNKTIYTITGSSGMNGAISSEGDSLVQREENFVYSLIPDSSYYVLDVLLDGVSIVSDISFSEGIAYDTLWSVSDNHTIHATFEPIVETWPEVYPVDYGDGIGSAELSGGVANVEGSFALDLQDSIPDAGNIDVVLTFAPANTDHCVAQYNTVNILVNQVDLTISAIPDTIRYNATAYEGGNGLIFDGFVNGEDRTVLFGTGEFGGSSQGAVDPGTYLIVPSGYTSENYDISYLETELIILQAELQVAAIDNDKIFGESDPEFAYEITEGSLLGADVLTGTLSREEGEAVGAYQILLGDLNAGSNYNLDFEAATLTILGQLSLSSSEGGEVTEPGEGIFTYTEPMDVQISAQALESYNFSHWSGDIDNLSTTDNKEISILVDGNYSIMANFVPFSTALKDLTVDQFTVYPNPTRDYVYIDLSPCEFNTLDMNFQLFDMQGRLLKEGKIFQDQAKVSFKSYHSGLFLLKIFNENIPAGSTVILKK